MTVLVFSHRLYVAYPVLLLLGLIANYRWEINAAAIMICRLFYVLTCKILCHWEGRAG